MFDIMRRINSSLLMTACTLLTMAGCSSLSMFGLNQNVIANHQSANHHANPQGRPHAKPDYRVASSSTQPASPPQMSAPVAAQVAYISDADGPSQECVSGAATHSSMPSAMCPSPGCRGCQSCQVQPYGYAPISPYYFNPYLIDPNEFICDGGDNPPKARARGRDGIIGIDLEDTVVRYTTDAGDVHVQPSNKVCLYAPRFAAVRRVVGAESGGLAVGAVGYERPEGPVRAQLNQPGLAVTGRSDLGRGSAVRGPDAMRARDRSVPVEVVLQPEMAEDVLAILANLAFINRGILRDTDKPWISKAAVAAIMWSIDEEVAVTVNSLAPVTLTRDIRAEEIVVYDFPDAGRLRICKLADKSDALPGEIVTFIIRVDNVGDSAVRDIVITDSLVTRLEYIPNSQTSTVDADFAFEANEGQSLRLTWKLANELKVGEGATIEFKCIVR
jgi:uncharacterized repeat protein (TIGR01451 family)